VHYPSDVLAGWILGTIVGVLSLWGEKIILAINRSPKG
jgi:membrane-associated phospholipid phosphatase